MEFDTERIDYNFIFNDHAFHYVRDISHGTPMLEVEIILLFLAVCKLAWITL